MNTQSISQLNKKLEKIPVTKKFLILVGVIGLIAALFYYQTYKPKNARIAALDGQIKRLSKELKENKELIKEIDSLKEGLGEIENRFKKIQAQLPTKKEIPDLLAKISDLANLLGLEFLLFKPRQEVAKEFYNEVPIDIKMKGTYNKVNEFFDFISKLPRIVNIKDIKMGNAKLVNKEVVINTDCIATTYRFSNNAAQNKKRGNKNAKRKKRK